MQTRARTSILLEKYANALQSLPFEGQQYTYERAYALYKLAREDEALRIIQDTSSKDRGLRVLEAQIVSTRVRFQDLSSSSILSLSRGTSSKIM